MPKFLTQTGRSFAHTFAVTGVLAVATGKSRIYMDGSYEIESVRVAVNTAPTGSAVVVDVNKNGTTVYTTQTNRPSVAAGQNTGAGVPDVTALVDGDYLTVDVDSIGSTAAGSDLTVTIKLVRV